MFKYLTTKQNSFLVKTLKNAEGKAPETTEIFQKQQATILLIKILYIQPEACFRVNDKQLKKSLHGCWSPIWLCFVAFFL